ncbi:hypothetical protein HDU93_000279 [Gonapodya sp. JEL0774]|nr:hypothetical protein HDU93_000279 [Gonapodya sp. JEL0774]
MTHSTLLTRVFAFYDSTASLLSNLASNSQQLQRVFSQQDFILDGANHELWNAGLTVIIRYSKEEISSGTAKSDQERHACSIVLKETIFFESNSGKPYFEVREKEESTTLDNVEVKQVLLGANVTAQSTSSIIRDVVLKYPGIEGGIRCIGSFKNFRHVFIWNDIVIVEVDRCSFPHGEGFFCRFDVDEEIIMKVLTYLQTTGVTYCINITSKTALFFQGLEEIASQSPNNKGTTPANAWSPTTSNLIFSSPPPSSLSVPMPLEPRPVTTGGLGTMNPLAGGWTGAPFTAGSFPAVTVPYSAGSVVTLPAMSTLTEATQVDWKLGAGSVLPITNGSTNGTINLYRASMASTPALLPLPPPAPLRSHSVLSSGAATAPIAQPAPTYSTSISSQSVKAPSFDVDVKTRQSGGGPVRTVLKRSPSASESKSVSPGSGHGNLSDGGPIDEETAEQQKKRNREASARYRRKKQVEFDQLNSRITEQERTIQELRERVRELEGSGPMPPQLTSNGASRRNTAPPPMMTPTSLAAACEECGTAFSLLKRKVSCYGVPLISDTYSE